MPRTVEVAVIGGGYAGVAAANRLAGHDRVAVTLINPRPHFTERIRLHQLAAGTHEAVADYRDVLAGGVRLVAGTVTRIDAAGRALTLADGDTLGYDYLIYAVGSGPADPGVPGAAAYAHGVATLEDARRLAAAVRSAPASAPLVVVGGGLTGVETAAELAAQGRAVTLVCGARLAPSLHATGRRAVARLLGGLGVRVLDGPGAEAAEVTPGEVRLADGRELPAAVTVWAGGFAAPDLAARSGLRTDALGRMVTDETLTSVDDPRIVAAGDAAAPAAGRYRMSCQAAVQAGPQAAETVLTRIRGADPAPLRVRFVAQCVSLARQAGVVQLTHRDDRPARGFVGGRTGAAVKELICRGTLHLLAGEARRAARRARRTADGAARPTLATGRERRPAA